MPHRKALRYLYFSESSIPEATNIKEPTSSFSGGSQFQNGTEPIISAANVVRNFENPKVSEKISRAPNEMPERMANNIKRGDTLQTAASKPHGGISLYRDILANVLDSASKGMKEILDAQGNAVENSMPECVGQSPLPYTSEGFLFSILQTFC